YDLVPRRRGAGDFYLGAFAWPFLIERAFGTLYPVTYQGPRWICAFGADPRMPQGDGYPRLISNDGFRVSADEARQMARCARNLCAIQRAVAAAAAADPSEDWKGVLFRSDWVVKFEQFADWAEGSGGFRIT